MAARASHGKITDSNETLANQNVAAPVNISEAIVELNSAGKKTDNWYLQRIKKRPISGVGSDADTELTWYFIFCILLLFLVKKVSEMANASNKKSFTIEDKFFTVQKLTNRMSVKLQLQIS